MIHYHGLPITPEIAAVPVVSGGHVFISFKHPTQVNLALECASSFALDNGAFSAWRAGTPITDWKPYYAWVEGLSSCPSFDFAVIPDVIDGDEAANDALLLEWPWKDSSEWIGAPVWHLHESLDRLQRLAFTWPRVCLGSSGQFARIGTPEWWTRMAEAMNVVCNSNGRPHCKLHGLRMLDPKVYTRFPFASADSTNIARNIGIDKAWNASYAPPNKAGRAALMRQRIESQQSPMEWNRIATQIPLLDEAA